MGNPINPDDPAWQDCPGCCNKLPETLNAKLEVPGLGTYTGVLTQGEVDKCKYSGTLADNGDTKPGYVRFCRPPDDNTLLWSSMGITMLCGEFIVPNNHCYPKIAKTSPLGCKFSIWP